MIAGVALLFALAPAALAQGEPGHVASPADGVWQTAPAPDDGVAWALLATTKEMAVEGSWTTRPVFTDDVKALDGQTVRMNGFMEPLGYGREQKHFILMAYPKDCPFCLTVGPTQLVEVMASTPVRSTYDMITVEGQMQIAPESEDGFFFRLTDARPVAR